MDDYFGTAGTGGTAGSPAEEPTVQTTSAAAKAVKPKKSSQPIPVHPESSLDPPGVVDALLLRHLGVQTNLADYQTDDIDDLCTQLTSMIRLVPTSAKFENCMNRHSKIKIKEFLSVMTAFYCVKAIYT